MLLLKYEQEVAKSIIIIIIAITIIHRLRRRRLQDFSMHFSHLQARLSSLPVYYLLRIPSNHFVCIGVLVSCKHYEVEC